MTKKIEKFTELELKQIEYAHLNLNLKQLDWSTLRNPFDGYRTVEDFEQIIKVIRDPKNFYFTCKHILNIEPTVFQLVWLEQLWKYPFPMIIANRGASKTFTTALYYVLRALITQGCKIVITSASFRQAKFVFEYMETIWNNAPVLKNLCGPQSGFSHLNDMWSFKIGESTVKAIPIGNGEKIRGLRANYICVEEFNSVPEEVYEIVIKGFLATSSNPVENIKNQAKISQLKAMDRWNDEIAAKMLNATKPNQVLISGTSGWEFQNFAKYWKKYHSYIVSRGDPDKLFQAIGSEPERGFDWRDYCIIRIPVDLLPDGMMEQKSLASSKADMDAGRFALEYGAVFSKDSNGFFKRSLIESCVTKEPIILPSGPVQFKPRLMGDPAKRYVMGVDPASEKDNFAIVIEEVNVDHNRVVYVWTTTRIKHRDRHSKGNTDDNNFYAFIARKIRDLMKVFRIEYISIDSQGGGISVMEYLHDNKTLEPGELPLWPLINESDPYAWASAKDWGYDDCAGPHILDMVNMARSEYVVEANHSLRKDLENKMLLFPHIDGLSLTLAEIQDASLEKSYDTMQELVIEIEELKEELSCVIHTTTLNGRDKWETPTILLPGNKKSYMRKDRYSALLMCNAMARRLTRMEVIDYGPRAAGGFAKDYCGSNHKGNLYVGPDWWCKEANSLTKLGGFRPDVENYRS